MGINTREPKPYNRNLSELSKKRVLMISGSYPPEICGVGDYTYQVMNTPAASDWSLLTSNDWSLSSIFRKIREIRTIRPDYIIIQHPTVGYGWSIVPQLLSFYFSLFSRIKVIVTLHEFSQHTLKARLGALLFLVSASRVVFTTDFEKEFASKIFPILKNRYSVIKIFTNIRSQDCIKPIGDRTVDLINFGLIRPNKGIEDYIEAVSTIKHQIPDIKCILVGQVPINQENYFKAIRSSCENVGIDVFRDLEEEDLSLLLNDVRFAYLPFPDGVSERRGTLLSVIKNGCIVFTTKGSFTSASMDDAFLFVDKKNAGEVISSYAETNLDELNRLQNKGMTFLNENFPKSWDEVTRQYLELMLLKN